MTWIHEIELDMKWILIELAREPPYLRYLTAPLQGSTAGGRALVIEFLGTHYVYLNLKY